MLSRDNGLNRYRFRVLVTRALICDTNSSFHDEDDVQCEFSSLTCVRPDAFRIDNEHRIVTVFEVEDTSRISREKADAYIDLWWAFDTCSWFFEVVVVDTNGHARHWDMDDLSYDGIDNRPRGKRPMAKAHMQIFDVFREVVPSIDYDRTNV
jgi:hypothetical protein